MFVQLANFGARHDEPAASQWAELREAQSEALHLDGTAMAVAIDIGEGDNIHPKNKQELGRRLALIARARVYGESVACSGPVYLTLLATFKHISSKNADYGAAEAYLTFEQRTLR